jgi:hypothetical protein
MGQERPVVVDGRNVVDADGFIGAGFVYKGIGRGDKNDHSINNQTKVRRNRNSLRHVMNTDYEKNKTQAT